MDVTFNLSCVCRVNDIDKKAEVSEIQNDLTDAFLTFLGFSETEINVYNVEYHNEKKG